MEWIDSHTHLGVVAEVALSTRIVVETRDGEAEGVIRDNIALMDLWKPSHLLSLEKPSESLHRTLCLG